MLCLPVHPVAALVGSSGQLGYSRSQLHDGDHVEISECPPLPSCMIATGEDLKIIQDPVVAAGIDGTRLIGGCWMSISHSDASCWHLDVNLTLTCIPTSTL